MAVTKIPRMIKKEEALIAYCFEDRTREEMMAYLGLENREHFRKTYLKPLLESGRIKMTIPDKTTSKNQKYKV